MTFQNQKRTCRYSDCMNAEENNVCQHHEAEDDECFSICGGPHKEELNDARCECWITCNACREDCGIEPLSEAAFLKEAPDTLREIA